MADIMCHCGKPLHYSDPALQAFVEYHVQKLGADVPVRVFETDRVWLVPRHYIALHGLKAEEIGSLGFKEVADE